MSQSPSGKHAGTASASKTDEDKSRPMHHKIVTNLQIQRAESTGSAYDGDISSPGSSPTESRVLLSRNKTRRAPNRGRASSLAEVAVPSNLTIAIVETHSEGIHEDTEPVRTSSPVVQSSSVYSSQLSDGQDKDSILGTDESQTPEPKTNTSNYSQKSSPPESTTLPSIANLESGFQKLDLTDPPPSAKKDPEMHLLKKLLAILTDPKKRRALRERKGDQAQLMIEYLYSVVLRPAPPPDLPLLQMHSLTELYKLCKESQLYPHCYALKDIPPGDLVNTNGGFSDVYKVNHNGKELCLKVVRLMAQPEVENMLKIYLKEAILWGHLNHRNIAPFYGVFYHDKNRTRICLVSPWMKRGTVVEYLKVHSSAPRASIIYDIATGLEYLHSRDMVHGDIKGTNILINDDGIACLTDFGLSHVRTDNSLAHTASITLGFTSRWAAPELLDEGARASKKSDVWALGCVCYEVLTGNLPYSNFLSESQVIVAILQGTSPAQLDAISGPDAIRALVNDCWTWEPESRPGSKKILEELDQGGFNGVAGEGHEQTVHETLRFRSAMKENEEVPINLNQVEEILDSLCVV